MIRPRNVMDVLTNSHFLTSLLPVPATLVLPAVMCHAEPASLCGPGCHPSGKVLHPGPPEAQTLFFENVSVPMKSGPKGITDVLRRADTSDEGLCQNPEFIC